MEPASSSSSRTGPSPPSSLLLAPRLRTWEDAYFAAGVTACLRSWSALKEAVARGWGGTESHAKAEDLRLNILEHFCAGGGAAKNPRLSVDDLEDNLAIYMEEEFSVVLEDDSERQIAATVWQLFEEKQRQQQRPVPPSSSSSSPAQQQQQLAVQLVQLAEGVAARTSSEIRQIRSADSDDDDSDDDEEMDTEEAAVETTTTTSSGGTMMPVQQQSPSAFSSSTAPPQPTPSAVEDSAAAAPVLSPLSNFDPFAYACQPLFPGGPRRKPTAITAGPVRQLGETTATEPAADRAMTMEDERVDDDGFAPVVSRRKKNRNT